MKMYYGNSKKGLRFVSTEKLSEAPAGLNKREAKDI